MIDRRLQPSAGVHSSATADVAGSSPTVAAAIISTQMSNAMTTQQSPTQGGIVLDQGQVGAQRRGEDDGPTLLLFSLVLLSSMMALPCMS